MERCEIVRKCQLQSIMVASSKFATEILHLTVPDQSSWKVNLWIVPFVVWSFSDFLAKLNVMKAPFVNRYDAVSCKFRHERHYFNVVFPSSEPDATRIAAPTGPQQQFADRIPPSFSNEKTSSFPSCQQVVGKCVLSTPGPLQYACLPVLTYRYELGML